MNEESVFAALASTPRRRILAYLSETPLTAGEIAARFDMTKPSLSKHLQILEHAGLIESQKLGQFVHYRIADGNLLGTLHNYLLNFCPVGAPLKKESAALAKARKPAAPARQKR
ncbi:metalloregulator ArsR/SmtB family transcription factor [Achromobacter deleyi]|uniref:metalloregulator ArsR/SmtB family transcription factor n=1 Tax=Achromobacter deleyi TaxID=1353891 RepID=UPI0014911B37|nr:metalloregulator ArsR/SmtB family transcription factor [Achromobacter deleyi]QVQ27735.1 winged helix-turn-helix transcriptional regulator [Achromobacter deleyi]UIP23337.1 metalloregulator ArsR/SmtB family transcription factor [Achromobacter deleyi]